MQQALEPRHISVILILDTIWSTRPIYRHNINIYLNIPESLRMVRSMICFVDQDNTRSEWFVHATFALSNLVLRGP